MRSSNLRPLPNQQHAGKTFPKIQFIVARGDIWNGKKSFNPFPVKAETEGQSSSEKLSGVNLRRYTSEVVHITCKIQHFCSRLYHVIVYNYSRYILQSHKILHKILTRPAISYVHTKCRCLSKISTFLKGFGPTSFME